MLFWVKFGVENWPKKESFGVDFTSRGKHIPKQEDMFGCHVLGPKILRPPLCFLLCVSSALAREVILISSSLFPVGRCLFICERPQHAVFLDRSQLLLATAQLDSIVITGLMGPILTPTGCGHIKWVRIFCSTTSSLPSAHCPRPQFTTLQYSSPRRATAQSVTFLCSSDYFWAPIPRSNHRC
jgi:hypothetical protein